MDKPRLVTQHTDDPDGYIWVARATLITGRSKDWLKRRMPIVSIERRDYVKIDELNHALTLAATPTIKE